MIEIECKIKVIELI